MTDRNYTDFQTVIMIARTSSPYEPRCGVARPCRFSSPAQRQCLLSETVSIVGPRVTAVSRRRTRTAWQINGGARGVRCADPQLCVRWRSLAFVRTLAESGQPEVQYRSR